MSNRIAFAVLAIASLNAHAREGAPVDLAIRYPYYHTTISLDADGRSDEKVEWARVVLKESALESSKTASIEYSTSAQTGEVLDAYTLKADGRRIDVPKDNYQLVINRGSGGNSPVYSDETSLSVVFPDLAVGDTVVFSYRIRETEPLFPGKYSNIDSFDSTTAYDDVKVTVDYPANLSAQYESHGMEQTIADTGSDRKTVTWHYANPNPVQDDRKDWSVYDWERQANYAFSTFSSYADISGSYGARATPKAEVTERIRKLAADIVGDASAPKEQARALYEWVSTNISYAGNCIGIGAVVPRDLPFVLDNKIGDCKDHATLLQALLESRGIHATQALINAGSVYSLPKVPVVSTVNHVINYIPSLDLYLDSTSAYTPFGLLPPADQGKPVLLVENYRPDSRTPMAPAAADSEIVKINFSIDADGSAAGEEEVFRKGEAAASLRAWARQLDRNTEADLVRNMFRQRGLIGDGTFSKDDPAAHSDSYHYKLEYHVQKFVRLPGAGAFYVSPPSGNGSIQKALRFTQEAEKEVDVACHGAIARDEYEIHFPKAMRILSIPDDVDLSNAFLRYRASYHLKGQTLGVRRLLEATMPGPVCSPQVVARYKEIGEGVMDDLRSQILYKLPKPRLQKPLHATEPYP